METDTAIAAGFANPPIASAHSFRAILDALSRPGRVQALPELPDAPAPLNATAAAIALTLMDHDTPVWLDAPLRTPAVTGFLAFHCGSTVTEKPGQAAFAIITDMADLPPLEVFPTGTPDYPDHSATIIVQVPALEAGAGVTLTGPGIENEHRLHLGPDEEALWRAIRRNNEHYPLGLDFLFAAPSQVAGCPRSTRIQITEAT